MKRLTKAEAIRVLVNYVLNGNIAGQFGDDDELVIAAKLLIKSKD